MKNAYSNRPPYLLSIPEAAWVLGVDNSVVCRAVRLGLLPVVRRRRRVLIPAHALAHLANGGMHTEPPAGATGRGGA
jgi:excisionase family DNA binding protein